MFSYHQTPLAGCLLIARQAPVFHLPLLLRNPGPECVTFTHFALSSRNSAHPAAEILRKVVWPALCLLLQHECDPGTAFAQLARRNPQTFAASHARLPVSNSNCASQLSICRKSGVFPIQFAPPINFDQGHTPICVGDFNGDGFPDLSSATHTPPSLF